MRGLGGVVPRCATRPALPLLLALLMAQPLSAHLMEHQHGTLNFVERRGYLVLSVPVSHASIRCGSAHVNHSVSVMMHFLAKPSGHDRTDRNYR